MKHLPAHFPLILFATGFLATATHAQNGGASPAGSVLLQRGNPVERESWAASLTNIICSLMRDNISNCN